MTRTLKIPANTAPLAAIVAFCRWNDRNGNWPEHRSAIDPSQFIDDNDNDNDKARHVSAPPTDAHSWYDWEGDSWLTDDECRAQLVPVLEAWRVDYLPVPEALARAFSRVLTRWLTPNQMEQTRAANAAETVSSVCHSHDFCDANMTMQEALESFAVDTFDERGEMPDAVVTVWNAAWKLAKAAEFHAERVTGEAMRAIAHDALAMNNQLAPRLVKALASIRDHRS